MFKKVKYGKLNYSINKNDYFEFTSRKEADSWGIKYYQDWAVKYNETMKSADRILKSSMVTSPVEFYCGFAYKPTNSLLRFGYINNFSSDELENRYNEMANLLTVVLCSAPRIPCNIITYRLVCDDFVKLLIEKNKQEYPIPAQEKGFMSTSLLSDIINMEEPYALEKNLLKIYIPKDNVGIYVNAVTDRPEQEILLPPNSFLGLIEYPYKDFVLNTLKSSIQK